MTKNKRFENRLNKDIKKFHALNPVWDNEKQDALNVFEMIDLLNELNEKSEISSLKFESDTANLLQKRKINVKDSIIEAFFKKSLHKFSTKVNEDIKNNNVVNTPMGFEVLYKNYKYRIVMFAQEELKE